MLSLHGILTGGDAPLHPVTPFWKYDDIAAQIDESGIADTDKAEQKDMPVTLKLVFPNGDGKGKEFSIDLNPSVDNNGS